MSLVCNQDVDLTDKRIVLFSYGSGCAASMFTIRAKEEYSIIREKSDYHQRLDNRIKKSPEFYEAVMAEREATYGHANKEATGPIEELIPGTFYLTKIDEKWRRDYSKVPCLKKPIIVKVEKRGLEFKDSKVGVMASDMISYNSQRSKLFALSKL